MNGENRPGREMNVKQSKKCKKYVRLWTEGWKQGKTGRRQRDEREKWMKMKQERKVKYIG